MWWEEERTWSHPLYWVPVCVCTRPHSRPLTPARCPCLYPPTPTTCACLRSCCCCLHSCQPALVPARTHTCPPHYLRVLTNTFFVCCSDSSASSLGSFVPAHARSTRRRRRRRRRRRWWWWWWWWWWRGQYEGGGGGCGEVASTRLVPVAQVRRSSLLLLAGSWLCTRTRAGSCWAPHLCVLALLFVCSHLASLILLK